MPQSTYDDGYADEDVDEGWAPVPGVLGDEEDFRPRRYVGGGRDEDYEANSYPDETSRLRQRGIAGVLTERGTVGSAPANSARLLAIGGAVVLVLFVLLAAVLLARGGGGDSNAIAAIGSATPDTRTATVIAVGGTASASTTAKAGAGASPSAGNGTATPGSATATSTPESATATPTAVTTPTQAPTATAVPPTPTNPPPTPTPQPPTPTPAPVLPSASQFSECTKASNGEYDCGPAPYHVVCPAPGQWFVDVPPYDGGSFPWKDVNGPGLGGVLAAGQSGCQ
jgi:hypothetical protein